MDWKTKLSSRKFWAAVAEFVAMLILAFGVAETTATQVSAIIMAGGGVIAYILAEGFADAAGAKSETVVIPVTNEDKPPEEKEEE